MEDEKLVDLYCLRSEDAVAETSLKYGSYCFAIANNILGSTACEKTVNLQEGTVTRLNLCAGALSAELEVPSFRETGGAPAADARTPEYNLALSNYVLSWCELSAADLLEEHIVSYMEDGTTIPLAELESPLAGWILADWSEESATMEYLFATPLELSQAERVEFVQEP